jgi:hypothetical protein
MKVRNGFVSNSSSSSFIIGIGVLQDEDAFNSWRQNVKIDSYDMKVVDPEDYETSYDFKEKEDSFVVVAPINDEYPEVELPKSGVEGKKIVILCKGNDEGDGAFTSYDPVDPWGELDHDIDLDFFGLEDQRLFKEFGEDISGIAFADKTYGAGRNG